jgi:hypothetical protein
MTYLSDRTRTRKQYRYYVAAFIVLLLITYFWPTIKSTIYPYIERFVIITGESKNAVIRIPYAIHTYFVSHKELEARNAGLLVTIANLENELAEKNAALSELGALAASGSVHPASTLTMYPLMRDITTIYSSLILSKGFKDGVVEKDLVYVQGRKPVCVVAEVYDRTSLCRLLTASGEETESITETNSVTLFLKGDGGGMFIAEVPRDMPIALGEKILLKSDPSMTLGTVADIVRNDQAVAWRVYVRGAYNPVTSSVFYVNK